MIVIISYERIHSDILSKRTWSEKFYRFKKDW